MSDQERYQAQLDQMEQEWEKRCDRCGSCCGAFDDPCVNLQKDGQGRYRCAVYDRRLGMQQTVGGKKFHCIPIREILHMHWGHDHLCAYKRPEPTP